MIDNNVLSLSYQRLITKSHGLRASEIPGKFTDTAVEPGHTGQDDHRCGDKDEQQRRPQMTVLVQPYLLEYLTAQSEFVQLNMM